MSRQPNIEKRVEITPEILKANGFYYGITSSEEHEGSLSGWTYEKGWCLEEGVCSVKVIFPNEFLGGIIQIDDGSLNRHLGFNFPSTVYLDELQRMINIVLKEPITIKEGGEG